MWFPKPKKRRLSNFFGSDYNGLFLENSHLKPWQIFCFSHGQIRANCKISRQTAVDWRSFCSEVKEFWFCNQEPIGRRDKIVEIDKTKWKENMSGAEFWAKIIDVVERDSKKCGSTSNTAFESKTWLCYTNSYYKEKRSPGVSHYKRLLEGIFKFIFKRIYTRIINHTENFFDPVDSEVHTQNTERLWREVNDWISAHLHAQILRAILFSSELRKRKALNYIPLYENWHCYTHRSRIEHSNNRALELLSVIY